VIANQRDEIVMEMSTHFMIELRPEQPA
jgi:hypothetical protein